MSRNPQTPERPLTNVFINYRRDDTRSDAGRLESDLERYFPGRVFRDVHDIEAGTDFMEVINKEVGECGALLVMIGQKWLTVTDKAGKRRLDNPDDPVAAEIAGALKRKDVRVIPVLVQDAKMPEDDDLPEHLKGLAHRNATKLDDEYWSADVARLVSVLEKVCGASPQPAAQTGQTAQPKKVGLLGAVEAAPGMSGLMRIAIAAGVAALVAALTVGIFLSRRGGPRRTQDVNAGIEAKTEAALVIEPTPEPEGLRILVKGAGVERMFAKQRPKDVALMTVRPDEEAESELTTTVEYK
jgi:hypothetical protein